MSVGITTITLVTAFLVIWGQRKQWGVAPVGLLGLVFVIPMLMLLLGVL